MLEIHYLIIAPRDNPIGQGAGSIRLSGFTRLGEWVAEQTTAGYTVIITNVRAL